jgi:hypothetical protein
VHHAPGGTRLPGHAIEHGNRARLRQVDEDLIRPGADLETFRMCVERDLGGFLPPYRVDYGQGSGAVADQD